MYGAPNYPATHTPTANHVPLARDNGKIDADWIDFTLALPVSQTPGPNLIPKSRDTGKIDIDWIDINAIAEAVDSQITQAHQLLDQDLHADTELAAANRGSLIVGNSLARWAALPIGAANKVLRCDGTDAAWDLVNLNSDVTDTLNVTNGGTGWNGVVPGAILYGADVNLYGFRLIGTAGQFLRVVGGLPDWDTFDVADIPAHDLLSATHGDTLAASVSRGSIIVGNATPKWSELVVGAANTVLRSNGTDVAYGQVVLTTDVSGILPVANGGTAVASLSDVLGTTNQVNVASGAARVIGGNVTLSLPQDIHTAATPQFARLGLGGAAHASRQLSIGGAGQIWDNTELTFDATTSFQFNGKAIFSNDVVVGAELFTLAATPAQITADQHDYALGNATFVRLSSDATRTITGFDNEADGLHLILVNVGSQNIVLANQSASSSAQHRIITGTGSDLAILPDERVELTYDATTLRWRCGAKVYAGGMATPGGSDTQVQFNDGGVFGGDAGFVFNKTTNFATLTGGLNIAAPSDGGTNVVLNITADGPAVLEVYDGGQIVSWAHLFFGPDNTWDIGEAADQRPRNVYAGTALRSVDVYASSLSDGGMVFAGADGVLLTDSGFTYDPTTDALEVFNVITSEFTSSNIQLLGSNGAIFSSGGGLASVALTQGDILYASAANTLDVLAKSATATRYLSNTGASNNPAWAQINLANGVTGTLPVGNGGTGATAFGANRVIFMNSGNTALTSDADFIFDGSTLDITANGTTTPLRIRNSGDGGTLSYGAIRWDNDAGTIRGLLTGADAVGGPWGMFVLYGTASAPLANDRIGEFEFAATNISPTDKRVAGITCEYDKDGSTIGMHFVTASQPSHATNAGLRFNIWTDGNGGTAFGAYADYNQTRPPSNGLSVSGLACFGRDTATARVHLGAGTTAASTAPLKFATGTSMTAAEAGAMEFTTDDLFFTITTGAARKRLLMADPTAGLTSGRVPFATTNGRLTDDADLLFATDTLSVTKAAVKGGGATGHTAKVGGVIESTITTAANVGTAETDLWSVSIPANTLNADKESVYFVFHGRVASGGSGQFVRVHYGATQVFIDGSLAHVAGVDMPFVIEGWIVRTGAATQKVMVVFSCELSSNWMQHTSTTETLSGAVTLRITGDGDASDEVFFDYGKIMWQPA